MSLTIYSIEQFLRQVPFSPLFHIRFIFPSQVGLKVGTNLGKPGRQIPFISLLLPITPTPYMKKQDLKKYLALGIVMAGSTGVLAAQNAYAEDLDATEDLSEATAETQLPAPRKGGPHFFDENLTRSVEDIENGVIITLTTDDADTLEHLQNIPTDDPDKGPFADQVTREIALLDNGVQITLTSDDARVVERLQNMDEMPPVAPMGSLDIDRTVENTENGRRRGL